MRGAWHGSGPPVVLIHGQPGGAADWQLVVPLLAGLSVLAPLRPGYDGSPAGGFDHNARALLALLEEVGPERVVLVGHSWGGGVALTTALLAPHRVAALALLGSVGSPRAVAAADRLTAVPGIGGGLVALMQRFGPRFAGLICRSTGSRLTSEQFALFRATLQQWGQTRAWHSFLVEQRAFVADTAGLASRLGQVRTPAVVLAGQHDGSVPLAAQVDLAQRLPAATLRQVDAGHLLTLEAPWAVAEAVREAVRRSGLPAGEQAPPPATA